MIGNGLFLFYIEKYEMFEEHEKFEKHDWTIKLPNERFGLNNNNKRYALYVKNNLGNVLVHKDKV